MDPFDALERMIRHPVKCLFALGQGALQENKYKTLESVFLNQNWAYPWK